MGKKIINGHGGEIEIVTFDEWMDHLAALVRAEGWPEESILLLYEKRDAVWKPYFDEELSPEEALADQDERDCSGHL